MDIGFKASGFEIAVAVEADAACCNTLRLNNPELNVIEGDICQVSTQKILDEAQLKPLEAALVIGGPPCQSFSLAGKRMGMNDSRGMLLLEFVRIVHEALPRSFVMENVKGMLNWERGKALEAVLAEFNDPVLFEGDEYVYDVSFKVLNSADFGVSQNRERLFIVGNRVGKTFRFPKPTHGISDLADFDLKPFASTWDAIGHLPSADEPSETAKRVSQTIKGRIANHGY